MGLFHEAMSGDECSELPGYWGQLFDQSCEPEQNTTVSVASPATSSQTFLQPFSLMSMKSLSMKSLSMKSLPIKAISVALTVMISVSASMGFSYWMQSAGSAPETNSQLASPAISPLISIDSLGLTSACLLPPDMQEPRLKNEAIPAEISSVQNTHLVAALPKDHFQDSVGVSQLHCCTYCHQARPEHTVHTPATVERITHSCQLCHVSLQ